MSTKNFKLQALTVFGVVLSIFSFLLIPGSSALAQVPPGCPENITSYWMFDETSGTTFIDAVGGHNASCTGGSDCPSFTTPGKINNALVFDGTYDGINVSADASFNWGNNDSFSIEFWMKTDSASTCSGNQVIVGRDDSATNLHWWVGCYNLTGAATFQLVDNNNFGPGAVKGTTDLTDGNWHHVVAVRNGVTGVSSIYVDGQLEGSKIYTYNYGFGSNTAALNIGWLNLSPYYHFAGTIDEVALYNRALSGNEIRSQYYLVHNYCDMCSIPVRIMPLGDSITKGNSATITDNNYMMAYRQKLYLDLIGSGYNIDFVGSLQSGSLASPPFDIDHEGHNGFTADQVSTDVNTWLSAHPADVVLLHIGTNDISGNNEDAQEVADILNQIDNYSEDVPVILARIISRTDGKAAQTTAFNDAVEAMAVSRIANGDKIIIVDQEGALNYIDDMDGTLHPNLAGYNKMAAVWLNALNDFLPLCKPAAPSITSIAVTEAYAGWLYTYKVDATGNPAPIYSLVEYPPGMTIDSNTGLIQWTPATTGTFDVTVQAENGVGTPATQSFALQVVEPPPCPPGIIHYWKLDDIGSPYMDFYGANNGTCTNCPAATTGIINGAQQFNVTSQVNVADDNTFDWNATDSFSIEFWMKTDSASTCSGNQVIVGRDDSATNLHWWVGCYNLTGAATFQLVDNNNFGPGAVKGTTDLTDGNWHHVVAVRNGVTGLSSIYVDGQLEGSKTYTYNYGFGSNTAALNIGWLNLSPYYHFAGTIDEVALYNKALPDVEILQHYSCGSYNIGYCELVAPSIISNPIMIGGVGQFYTYDVEAIGNPAPTYSLLTSPSGMTIDPGTGLIEWTPDADGPVDVSVQASNGMGTPAVQNFTINVSATYAITASAGSGGSISPSGSVSVNHGASQAFTINPDTNYHIADVKVDGSSVGAVASYTFYNVTANHTIEATFAIDTHTITATAGSGGSISPSGSVTVNHGASQAFTINPDTNYHIADVKVDGSSVGAVASYTFYNVTANHTIEATFAIDTHTITASAGSGGSISPSGAVTVNYGADQTFSINPYTGYHIADVKVDGSTAGAVASYTFYNVTANHTIEATYDQVEQTFADVITTHWAFDYIEAIKEAGITTGYGDGTYGPGDPVTREQMAAFIIRALLGETFDYSTTPYFVDVPSSHWAFKYVQKLKELGITQGCGGSAYCPGSLVTRDQMAAFLIRAKVGEDFSYESAPYFTDVSSDHWAFDYIQKLKELGITTGCGSGSYCPDSIVTRDQMAALLYRAFLQ